MMPAAPAGSDLAQGPDASVVGERGEAPPRVAHVLPHQHQTRHGNSPRRQPGDAPARQFPRPPGAPPQSRQGRRDRRGPLRRVGPGGQRAGGAVRGGVAPVPPAWTSDRTVGGGGAVGGGVGRPPGPDLVSRDGVARDVRSGGGIAAGLGPDPELLPLDAVTGVHVAGGHVQGGRRGGGGGGGGGDGGDGDGGRRGGGRGECLRRGGGQEEDGCHRLHHVVGCLWWWKRGAGRPLERSISNYTLSIQERREIEDVSL